MKLAINSDTRVGALLDAYPEAENVLIEMAPAFAKLRNPLVRRSVVKFATLEQAAKVGGVSLQEMILKLRDFTGEGGADFSTNEYEDPSCGPPSWVGDGRVVEEMDADAMLERGTHPIGKIRELLATLSPGEVIVLRSSFRPQPLIDVMRRQGLAVHSVSEGAAHTTHLAKPPEHRSSVSFER